MADSQAQPALVLRGCCWSVTGTDQGVRVARRAGLVVAVMIEAGCSHPWSQRRHQSVAAGWHSVQQERYGYDCCSTVKERRCLASVALNEEVGHLCP